MRMAFSRVNEAPGGSEYQAIWIATMLPSQGDWSQTVSFEEMNEGFDRLSDGRVLRQILLPHGTG